MRLPRRAFIPVTVGAVLLAVALGWSEFRRPHRYDTLIREVATAHGVDPALVKAVVWRESGFRAHARGRAGELGLMQLQEAAAMEWADARRHAGFEHEHCLDARTNLLAGSYYLSRLLKRYQHTDDPVPYALADYNAGRTRVLKWNGGEAATNSAVFVGQIGFASTRDYVVQVVRKQEHYRRHF